MDVPDRQPPPPAPPVAAPVVPGPGVEVELEPVAGPSVPRPPPRPTAPAAATVDEVTAAVDVEKGSRESKGKKKAADKKQKGREMPEYEGKASATAKGKVDGEADVKREEFVKRRKGTVDAESIWEASNLKKVMDILNSQEPFNPAELPPLRLGGIMHVGPVEAVRPSFWAGLFRPYINRTYRNSITGRLVHSRTGRLDLPTRPARCSVEELLEIAKRIQDDLQRLEVYEDVTVSLSPVPSESVMRGFGNSIQYLYGAEEAVHLLIHTKEAKRFFLKSSTDVGNGEGSVSIQGRIGNVFRGAERLEGSYEVGTRTKQNLNLNFSTPLFYTPDLKLSLAAFAASRDKTFYASCYESVQGFRAAIIRSARPSVTQDLSWNLAFRNLHRLTPTASVSMRKLAGYDAKSSLVYSTVRDTRDAALFGTMGSTIKSTIEWASRLLGGDANFVKYETEISINRRIGSPPPQIPQSPFLAGLSIPQVQEDHPWGWSFGMRGGLLKSLEANGHVPFADRFQLGGPTCVRMFKANTLGPKDGPDSLGGNLFYSLSLSLFSPLPLRPHWPLKIHSFVNAGQLSHVQTFDPLRLADRLSSSLSTIGRGGDSNSTSSAPIPSSRALRDSFVQTFAPSTSAGIGLMYSDGPLRVELNFGMPMTARRGDGCRKGVQVGIGVGFLG